MSPACGLRRRSRSVSSSIAPIIVLGVSGIPVTGVNELVLEVLDLDAAERFYAGVLGLPVTTRSENRVWLAAGEQTRIGLWAPQIGIADGRGGIHVHYAMHIDE